MTQQNNEAEEEALANSILATLGISAGPAPQVAQRETVTVSTQSAQAEEALANSILATIGIAGK